MSASHVQCSYAMLFFCGFAFFCSFFDELPIFFFKRFAIFEVFSGIFAFFSLKVKILKVFFLS